VKLRADRQVGLLFVGVVLLTFVAIGATVALPANDPSLQVKARAMSAEAVRGMKVYKSEGCWYCHTQYERHTATDAVLGKPLGTGRYAGLSPSMLGLERMGPDLTHLSAADRAALVDALESHGKAGSLAYLSAKDLEALAAYLFRK
jgi:cbb3-type cytochrome oxidase cytochrome c subunit